MKTSKEGEISQDAVSRQQDKECDNEGDAERESGGEAGKEGEEAMETEEMELKPKDVPNDVLVNDDCTVHQQQDQMTVGGVGVGSPNQQVVKQ